MSLLILILVSPNTIAEMKRYITPTPLCSCKRRRSRMRTYYIQLGVLFSSSFSCEIGDFVLKDKSLERFLGLCGCHLCSGNAQRSTRRWQKYKFIFNLQCKRNINIHFLRRRFHYYPHFVMIRCRAGVAKLRFVVLRLVEWK